MNKIINQAAQGDVLFTRVAELPAEALPAKAEGGSYVVAHSETGHHHVVPVVDGIVLYETSDPLIAYLQVSQGACDAGSAVLRHLRGWHTHEPIQFTPGVFRISRQVERAGSTWVRAQD